MNFVITFKEFVKNPNQFDDTAQLQAAGKLEAKLQQREKLMKISYGQLPDDEKEKDRQASILEAQIKERMANKDVLDYETKELQKSLDQLQIKREEIAQKEKNKIFNSIKSLLKEEKESEKYSDDDLKDYFNRLITTRDKCYETLPSCY